jgi:hypothetical protein
MLWNVKFLVDDGLCEWGGIEAPSRERAEAIGVQNFRKSRWSPLYPTDLPRCVVTQVPGSSPSSHPAHADVHVPPDDGSDTALRRWLGYEPQLGAITDRQLLVLKMHLVAEDALHHLLAPRLSVADGPLRGRRESFSTLRVVALAGDQHKGLRDILKHLNDARNSAAHALNDPEFERDVALFIDAARRTPICNFTHELPRYGEVTSDDLLEMLRTAGYDAIFAIWKAAVPFWRSIRDDGRS